MDFDSDLSKIQGALYSLGSRGLLNKTDSLLQVVEAIEEIVKDVSNNAKDKVTFFMYLNTDLSILDELRDDELVGPFINITPPIEKEFLIMYIYHLKLQPNLFKIIENTPSALTNELLDVILVKLKDASFHKDEFGIKHLNELWKSVVVRTMKEPSERIVNVFNEVYNLIQKFVVTGIKCGLAEFVGKQLQYFFENVLYLVRLQKCSDLLNDPMYEVKIDLKPETTVEVNCVELIFKDVFKVLEHLTLDLWMTFSECQADSNSSLQMVIGELVFDILNEVKSLDLPRDVISCLSSLAINKKELMAKSSVEEVIAKIKNGEKEWFKILISHADVLEETSIECIISHLHMADPQDLSDILSLCYKSLPSESDQIKKLFLAAFKISPSDWMEKVFENYRPNFLTTTDTCDEIVEAFNKISRENILDIELKCLCLQSPFETIKKICEMAVYGSHQTSFAVELLKSLKCACSVVIVDGYCLIDQVIESLISEVTQKESRLFVNLVVELGKESVLGCAFLNKIITRLKEYLEAEDLNKAFVCLEIIKLSLELKLFKAEEIPLLVFMSQVLGSFSWDLESFENLKAEGRDAAGDIIICVLGQMGEINGSKLEWARREISQVSEINQAYFCDLWFSSGLFWSGSKGVHSCLLTFMHARETKDAFTKFLNSLGQRYEVIASLVTALTVVLPVTTFREWNSLFEKLILITSDVGLDSESSTYCSVLDIFGSALHLLSLFLKPKEKFFPCYQYCLRNYGRLIKNYCSKLTSNSVLKVFEKIFVIVGAVENEEKRKISWEILTAVLIDLVDEMRKKKAIDVHKEDVMRLLPLLDLKKVAEAVEKKLQ